MIKLINTKKETNEDGVYEIKAYSNGASSTALIEPSEEYMLTQKKIEDEKRASINKTVSNMIRVNKDEYENLLKDVEIIKEVLMEIALKEAGLNA